MVLEESWESMRNQVSILRIFSPITISLIPIIIFIVSVVFPKEYYETLMGEKFFSWNIISVLYVIIMWISFLIGNLYCYTIIRRLKIKPSQNNTIIDVIPQVLAIVLIICLLQIITVLKQVGLAGLLDNSDTRLQVNEALAGSSLGWTVFFQIGLWSYLGWALSEYITTTRKYRFWVLLSIYIILLLSISFCSN